MKTAVEILEQQLYEWLDGRIYLPPTFFEQAKQMEKQQIVEAFIGYDSDTEDNLEVGEQYYNETFKSK
jgi:hypothetical protein